MYVYKNFCWDLYVLKQVENTKSVDVFKYLVVLLSVIDDNRIFPVDRIYCRLLKIIGSEKFINALCELTKDSGCCHLCKRGDTYCKYRYADLRVEYNGGYRDKYNHLLLIDRRLMLKEISSHS